MIKVNNLEKLFLILNEERIVRCCLKKSRYKHDEICVKKCPIGSLAEYRSRNHIEKNWICIYLTPKLTVSNPAEVIKALRKFISEIGK